MEAGLTQKSIREALAAGEFVITCELIPGRGAQEPSQEALMGEAQSIWNTGRVHALSVTDAPGGNPALSSVVFSADLAAASMRPLVHLSCKDRNRNQLEAELYAMSRRGISDVLCMTGDYPQTGWQGPAKPVFDLDSVTLLQQITSYNTGIGYPSMRGDVVRTAPGNLFAGAVISPAKWTEAEVLLQLFKAKKKAFAGAQYLITQLCFDARKLQECLQLLRDEDVRTKDGTPIPVIANVFLLTAGMAESMHAGKIPGCYVGEKLLGELRQERTQSADKGKQVRIVRAAKMVAFAKGAGFAGVHIGGFGINAATLQQVLDLAETYSDWQALARDLVDAPDDAWWAYKLEEQADGGVPLLGTAPSARSEFRKEKEIQGPYKLSRRMHELVFTPKGTFNKVFLQKEQKLEEKKGRLRPHTLEHLSKTWLFGCVDCGDCGLYACGYSCPMSACPKHQRNGACGGSKDGFCEVYPQERYCIWYKAYHRLKPYGDECTLAHYVVPPHNWSLLQKSPWGATSMGLDGYARRTWLEGAELDENAKNGVVAAEDAPRVY